MKKIGREVRAVPPSARRFAALNQVEMSVPITRADLGEPEGW
jgi:hypothetical protein